MKTFAASGILLAALFLASVAYADFSEETAQRYLEESVEKDRLNNAFLILRGDISLLDYRLKGYQIAQLDLAELRLLRNTIFARYGYRFQSPDLAAHFESFSWYEPSEDFNTDRLTGIDHQNIELISCLERNFKTSKAVHVERGEIEGIWHGSPVVGSGYGERYFFNKDGSFKWCSNQMDGSGRLFQYSGRWKLNRNVVEVTVTHYKWMEGGRIIEPYASYGSDYVIENGRLKTVDLSGDPPVMRFPVENYGIDEEWSRSFASDIISMRISGRAFYKGRYE
jgi:hypothetical protein